MHKMICNMCGNQFKSQITLTQHNKDVQIEVDLPCSLCDKTFRTKRHLANHKYYTHTEKESLQCDHPTKEQPHSTKIARVTPVQIAQCNAAALPCRQQQQLC